MGSQKGALRACNGKVIEKEGTFEIREDNFLSVQLGRPRPGEGQDLPVSYNKEVAEAGLSPRCPDPKPSLSPLPIRLLWRRTQQWSAHVHTKSLTPLLDPLPFAWRTLTCFMPGLGSQSRMHI